MKVYLRRADVNEPALLGDVPIEEFAYSDILKNIRRHGLYDDEHYIEPETLHGHFFVHRATRTCGYEIVYERR